MLQERKHSPTIYHGMIQTALEEGEVPEYLQYTTQLCGATQHKQFLRKGRKTAQILLKVGFALKQSEVKGPAQEIKFLGIKC